MAYNYATRGEARAAAEAQELIDDVVISRCPVTDLWGWDNLEGVTLAHTTGDTGDALEGAGDEPEAGGAPHAAVEPVTGNDELEILAVGDGSDGPELDQPTYVLLHRDDFAREREVALLVAASPNDEFADLRGLDHSGPALADLASALDSDGGGEPMRPDSTWDAGDADPLPVLDAAGDGSVAASVALVGLDGGGQAGVASGPAPKLSLVPASMAPAQIEAGGDLVVQVGGAMRLMAAAALATELSKMGFACSVHNANTGQLVDEVEAKPRKRAA